MKQLICPNCRLIGIILNVGGQTGKYECKKCGYIGALVVERAIDLTE